MTQCMNFGMGAIGIVDGGYILMIKIYGTKCTKIQQNLHSNPIM